MSDNRQDFPTKVLNARKMQGKRTTQRAAGNGGKPYAVSVFVKGNDQSQFSSIHSIAHVRAHVMASDSSTNESISPD